jgi:hypothetical protein
VRIGIVIPSIPGRESSLDRCLDSYGKTTGADCYFQVYHDSPCSGTGWRLGAELLEKKYGAMDFLHLTNDDCEAEHSRWWEDAALACEDGCIPAPVVLNSDGSLQSAGGDLNASEHLLKTIGEQGEEVGFTTIPFLSWEQWKAIGMLDIHYSSDVWVSYRGRQLDYPTVIARGYRIIHHLHQVGRGAGMPQNQRDALDRLTFERALDEA